MTLATTRHDILAAERRLEQYRRRNVSAARALRGALRSRFVEYAPVALAAVLLALVCGWPSQRQARPHEEASSRMPPLVALLLGLAVRAAMQKLVAVLLGRWHQRSQRSPPHGTGTPDEESVRHREP